MPKTSLVSIIIPTYNRAHLIKDTLDSVLVQTYPYWECIVVDDGSTDGTEQLVKGFAQNDFRFHYYKRPEHLPQGGNAARNYGFDKSKGDYIQWFDDDDLMLENYLEERLKAFKPKIKFVIGLGRYVDVNLVNIRPMCFDHTMSLFNGVVTWRNEITTASVLFIKTFLEDKSLFNTNLVRGQETELFSRLFFEVSPNDYIIVDELLFLYRQHDESKTGLNNNYVASHKVSEAYIAMENLKRGLLINDCTLIQFFYKVLINFFFRAIEHKHWVNARYIMKGLNENLSELAPSVMLQFKLIGHLFIMLSRGSYKFEMYFKTRVVC